MPRCSWAQSELMAAYHDREWGLPSHEDRHLFEMLILEGAQAGLSWNSILIRREAYREAYDGFDPDVVAGYNEAKRREMMGNPGIIRNRAKIEAAVINAKAFREVQAEFGSFDAYLWGFVGGKPIQNRFRNLEEIPAATPESERLSKDLRKRGFKFVGPTICYSFMQAVGMVNDHIVDCPRHKEVAL